MEFAPDSALVPYAHSFGAHWRARSPASRYLHLVELANGGLCLCQQHVPTEQSLSLRVTVFVLHHQCRLDFEVPLRQLTWQRVRVSRVFFSAVAGQLMVYVPGHYLRLLDCSHNHPPTAGLCVLGRHASPLPHPVPPDHAMLYPFDVLSSEQQSDDTDSAPGGGGFGGQLLHQLQQLHHHAQHRREQGASSEAPSSSHVDSPARPEVQNTSALDSPRHAFDYGGPSPSASFSSASNAPTSASTQSSSSSSLLSASSASGAATVTATTTTTISTSTASSTSSSTSASSSASSSSSAATDSAAQSDPVASSHTHYLLDGRTGIAYEIHLNQNAVLRAACLESDSPARALHLAIGHLRCRELADQIVQHVCAHHPTRAMSGFFKEYLLAMPVASMLQHGVDERSGGQSFFDSIEQSSLRSLRSQRSLSHHTDSIRYQSLHASATKGQSGPSALRRAHLHSGDAAQISSSAGVSSPSSAVTGLSTGTTSSVGSAFPPPFGSSSSTSPSSLSSLSQVRKGSSGNLISAANGSPTQLASEPMEVRRRSADDSTPPSSVSSSYDAGSTEPTTVAMVVKHHGRTSSPQQVSSEAISAVASSPGTSQYVSWLAASADEEELFLVRPCSTLSSSALSSSGSSSGASSSIASVGSGALVTGAVLSSSSSSSSSAAVSGVVAASAPETSTSSNMRKLIARVLGVSSFSDRRVDDFIASVDNWANVERCCNFLWNRFPRASRSGVVWWSRTFRLHQIAATNRLLKQIVTGMSYVQGPKHDSQLFRLLEELYGDLEELGLPLPDSFSDTFLRLGYTQLSRELFLQYLERGIFTVNANFVREVVHHCLQESVMTSSYSSVRSFADHRLEHEGFCYRLLSSLSYDDQLRVLQEERMSLVVSHRRLVAEHLSSRIQIQLPSDGYQSTATEMEAATRAMFLPMYVWLSLLEKQFPLDHSVAYVRSHTIQTFEQLFQARSLMS
mmetsp:Transcript_17905/g.53799  ORF Transcript_17905/g.53799 Transcript_17905/m.53799 type:complete len:964 (+) Transcript_17905:446-3337(+)